MGNYLTSGRVVAENHVHVKPLNKLINYKGRQNARIDDLPEDVLYAILSKLPAKEAARTSVLSSQWRCIWTNCLKLSFSGEQHTQMFIDSVNAVLQKHSDKVVGQLQIKFTFERKLLDHLDNWIRFVVSSRTKNLAFVLELPPTYTMGDDVYCVFPFELLDKNQSLECLQLRLVCFKPHLSRFLGFSNLRKLDLHSVQTTRQDLENILCNCCSKLEWLSMVAVHLDGELKVIQPFSDLQYLQVKYCNITKIEFHAAKLSTFVYAGACGAVAIHHATKLENANMHLQAPTFQQGAADLLNCLPNVQNLTLKFVAPQLETQWILDSPHVFSQLRHVQLLLLIFEEEFEKILYLVSFLRVAPVIEKLEIHFGGIKWFSRSGPLRRDIPPAVARGYEHLKNICVTGFRGATGQVELLLYVVEKAPVIEAVTVDTFQRLGDDSPIQSVNKRKPGICVPSEALNMVRGPLLERLPPHAKLALCDRGVRVSPICHRHSVI